MYIHTQREGGREGGRVEGGREGGREGGVHTQTHSHTTCLVTGLCVHRVYLWRGLKSGIQACAVLHCRPGHVHTFQ